MISLSSIKLLEYLIGVIAALIIYILNDRQKRLQREIDELETKLDNVKDSYISKETLSKSIKYIEHDIENLEKRIMERFDHFEKLLSNKLQ